MRDNRHHEEKKITKAAIIKLVPAFILLSLVIPILYLSVKMLRLGYYDASLMLMLLQCLLGLIAFFLPNFISRRWKLVIPSGMYIAFIVFLYCAIVLGEVRDFYYVIPHWDDILHFFSGMMLGTLGFSVVSLLNSEKNMKVNMSPVFVALFSVFFAVTMGVIWEIYEYVFDGLLGMNMQKFMLQDGTKLIGHYALTDTMQDLMIDMGGATLSAAGGYISLKKKDMKWKDFIIKKKDDIKDK